MSIGFWQIAIVVVLVVLLFGRGKISSLMGDVAKGIKSFKKGMKDPIQDQSDSTSSENQSSDEENLDKKKFTMPQIGWFEILIIVVVAILLIGPKDFPIMLRKIGSWIGSFKSYFSEFQKDITDVENTFGDEISLEKDLTKKIDKKKKDE